MSETTTFADFGVDTSIISALSGAGITSPFPIQELTLPLALSGADIIGQARTGTGKTLGFGIPLLQRVTPGGPSPQALVIVPTRELCLQVATDLAQAGRDRGVKVVAVYGGKAIGEQADALQAGADVVVGTPGRLLDMLRRRQLTLSEVRALVLDEADEMLDLGFLPDVEQLIAAVAEDRQTLLFSATMPGEVVALARRYMRKPTFLRADVEEIRIAPETQQYFFSCHRMDKPAVISRLLQDPSRGLALIFCRTKRMADILAEELREHDVKAAAIHSDLRQEARERALDRFRKGKIDVLVATEVAARGLDIESVTHVVNYDCPDDEKMYLHRIGRTGRAGAAGVAVTLALWNELPRLEMIRRELGITEEIQEVFSTSPLLDELFHLPPREARRQAVAAPKARGAAKGRGEAADDGAAPRGRGAKGRGGAQVGADEAPRGRTAKGSTEEAGSPVGAGPDQGGGTDDGEERPRSRGRRRRGGAGRTREPAPAVAAEAEVAAPEAGADQEAPDGGAAETVAGAAAPGEGGAGAGEALAGGAGEDDEEAPRTRRRSRRRGGDGAEGVEDQVEAGGQAAAAVDDGDAPAEAVVAEDGDQASEEGGARRRRRTRVGPTAPPRASGDGAGEERRTRTRPPGDRARAAGGDRGRATAARGDGSGRAASGERGNATRGERTGSGRDSRGKADQGGSRDGRRGRADRGGRPGDRSRRGERPYGKERRPRRPTVDPEVARGDGTPRTTRPMVITHLP